MPFYSDVRSLWVGDEKTHGKLAGKDLEQLSSPDLMLKYPFLNFGEHDVGFLDRAGGVINPRAQVDASILIASKNGCDVIRDIVDHVSRTDHSGSHAMVLETENRKTVYAKHVILATNSFTGSRDLLAGARVKFEASPQTVVFAEVAKKDQKQLR